MEEAERRRQALLEAQARARLEAAAAARAVAAAADARGLSDPVAIETGVTTTAPPAKYGGVVGIAMQYLGVPYVWGGASPSGSTAPGSSRTRTRRSASRCRTTRRWYNSVGMSVSRDQLAPGDLVFFDGLGHMGMYIGGDQFIHAPHTGDVVKISSLNDSWYVDLRRRIKLVT